MVILDQVVRLNMNKKVYKYPIIHYTKLNDIY